MKRSIYGVLLLALVAIGCNDAGQSPTDNTGQPTSTSTDATHHAIAVDDATFSDTVLASEQPILVDFWAPWCGPCQELTPIVEQIAAEYEGRVTVVKVNVDDAPKVMAQYDVTAIPTLVFLQDGEVVESIEGVESKRRLTQKLDAMLAE
jgi:thioredoxin 1